MGSTDFEFIPPPEAPVFEPSQDEFSDPLAYIAKIRPIAEKTGICKIKPPPEWQPPFAVDVDNFKFTPRIQRLNELEAKTRIKLNFLDKIAKFWELQGSSLKIPTIDRKALDLHALHKVVQDEGGFDCVTKDRKWSRVAQRMGYSAGKSIGSLLRAHYERILFPYAIFKSGASLDLKITDEGHGADKKDKDYVPHGIPWRQAIKPPAERFSRRSKRHVKESLPADVDDCQAKTDARDSCCEDESSVDYNVNSELRKLQCYGAGPKMPGFTPKSSDAQEEEEEEEARDLERTDARVIGQDQTIVSDDPIDQIMCETCGRGDAEESMLLCDGCDDSYHTFCLLPPLNEIPKGDWRCPSCIAVECRKPHEAFGFEQATKEYTLQSFGEMADQFKSDYFNMPVHMVPPSTVEREFWRIVSAIDEDVTVEYGADLHTMDHGSGFPTRNCKTCNPGDEEYACSGWNLNNLAVLEGSVLSHINADISGMKIPWMYVGMCFATFCWHNEDHWSYSINYLHWGEPKTWYGVPGDRAEQFEETMKRAAPELFESQPDLLHQLVTIMNPNILMSAEVPVYRTNQCAGEFVVTFPRAYHAGFNQGYNFAEAVNFCPSDWLSLGRTCIDHYSKLHRYCVFSHDELVCKMAADPEILDLNLAAETYQDMLQMVEREKNLRKMLLEKGVAVAEREAFELLPDDERQCEVCKTTCFLSAVTCACTKSLVCIRHVDELCKCHPSKLCLRYRYTLDELPLMLHRLKVRAESFDNWAVKVKSALEANLEEKIDLNEMKALIAEAEDRRLPDSDLLKLVTDAVKDANRCSAAAQQLVGKKVRTRNRHAGDAKYAARLGLRELRLFCERIDNLPCEIEEAALVKELLRDAQQFQKDAAKLMEEDEPTSKSLDRVLDVGLALDIDLPEIGGLKKKRQQVLWLEEVNGTLKDCGQVTVDNLQRLIASGADLPPHATLEKKMAQLQELLNRVEKCEEKARQCLQAKPRQPVEILETIVGESNGVPAYLPNMLALKDALKKAKEWSSKVDAVQNGEHYPYLEVLETLVNKGRPIAVRLELLPLVESQLSAAKSWRERTARTFLKKNSTYSLVEVLSPRADVGLYPNAKAKKKKLREFGSDKREDPAAFAALDSLKEDAKDPAAIVAQFKHAELTEVETMRRLRVDNLRKRAEDSGDCRYCVCRKLLSGMMLQCELCKDWFHAHCVPLPKMAALKGKGNGTMAAIAQLAKELKFLCPLCLRSRRPRLETILSLLVSLQKLPVRLPEGEALQCLTERAMSWQDRARQALATDELAAALAKLSVLSQRLVEQAAREKTEKIINAELMKAANNPDLQPHLHNMTQKAFGGDPLHSYATDSSARKVSDSADGNGAWQASSAEETSPTEHHDLERDHSNPTEGEDGPNLFSSSEHAYSSASKPCQSNSLKKHSRKSPLIPRQLEAPVLELSEAAKAQLEELMMEGDLLEVSLDETQHIWRILQATKPMADERFPDVVEDLDCVAFMRAKDKCKIKKRKVDDVDVNFIKEKFKVRKILNRDGEKTKRRKIKLDKDGKPLHRNMLAKKSQQRENASKENVDGCVRKTLKDKSKKLTTARKEKNTCDSNPYAKKRVKKTAACGQGSDAEEETCAATRCLRPTGEVNWVQCDGGCDLWFHLICVGLTKSDVSESEDYICSCCAKQQKSERRLKWECEELEEEDYEDDALDVEADEDVDEDEEDYDDQHNCNRVTEVADEATIADSVPKTEAACE